MVASSWYSPLLANVFIWIVTKGGDSLFIDPLAEQAAAFRSRPSIFRADLLSTLRCDA